MSIQERIQFTCPVETCGAQHDRGYVNGVDAFRCLRCGYVGHGFHPDTEIDTAIGKDIREAQAVNAALGLDPGPFSP